jgi:DNA-binding transcriptional regulator YiaG
MTLNEIKTKYDEFFGRGLWEREYKLHIVAFTEQCIRQSEGHPCIIPSLSEIDFRQLRKGRNFSLREVEERTGISNAYLSQLERGKIKSPGYETVRILYELYMEIK